MKRIALFFALGGIVLSGILGYFAMTGEITGKTFAYDASGNYGAQPSRRGAFVSVLRNGSPAQFRQANNFLWGLTGFCVMAAAVGVIFYRGLDDNE